MGIRINSPVPALIAQRQAQGVSERLNRGLEQLSSGLRITRAGDDPAGLAVAERFRMQVLQFNQEVDNFQSGISAAQTAEGGLGAQSEAVQRIRELAVRSANGTLSTEQRAALNQEAQQLVQQIEQTAQNTEFNGLQVLDGSAGTVTLDAGGTTQISFPDSTAAALGVADIDISTQAGANAAISAADTAGARINQNRATLGAQENRLASAINERETSAINLQEAESRIRDLDVARAAVDQSRDQLLLQAALSGVSQSNIQNQSALFLLGG